MKLLILAGGLGTRISEESHLRPKPMIEIGGRPILWHIMKIYSAHGINDFVIMSGYKHHVIKEYFKNYYLHNSDITFNIGDNSFEVHQSCKESWKVTVVDTGENTMTGGRIKKVKDYIGEEDFCLTYGDGLGNINISEQIEFHKNYGKLATVTAVSPSGRFGKMKIEDNRVVNFAEKPDNEVGYINGGFFILSPKVIDYIKDDDTVWEREPLETLAKEDQLISFRHHGFWQPMDTLRDKNELEKLWKQGDAPWKCW